MDDESAALNSYRSGLTCLSYMLLTTKFKNVQKYNILVLQLAYHHDHWRSYETPSDRLEKDELTLILTQCLQLLRLHFLVEKLLFFMFVNREYTLLSSKYSHVI